MTQTVPDAPDPTLTAPLTRRQVEVLNYIAEMQSSNNMTPKLGEIATAFGVSVGSVRQYLRALEKKGFLTVARYAHRGIRLTRGRREWKVRRSWQGEFDRRIGSKLEGETDLTKIFATVSGDLQAWLDVEQADLHVHDPHHRVLRGRSFYDHRPGDKAGLEDPATGPGSVIERAVRRRRVVAEAGTAAIPIQGRERVLGVLRLKDARPGRPDPSTLVRAGVAAAALAPALERAAVHADLQRRIRLQAALLSLCKTINSVGDLEAVLRDIYAIVAGLVEAPMFVIAVVDENGAEWLLHERDEVDGQVYEKIGPRPFRTEPGSMMKLMDHQPYVIRHRTPEEIREYENQGPGIAKDGLQSAGIQQKRSRSLMFVPLKSAGQRIGNLSVQSYRYNAYRIQDAEDLILIGEYIGMALRNALRDATAPGRAAAARRKLDRLEEELRRLAAGPAGDDPRPRLTALVADLEAHRRAPLTSATTPIA